MAGVFLWGWDSTSEKWIPVEVDASGNLKVDLSAVDLDDIGDVNVPTPTDGDVLYWDDAAGKWQDKAIVVPSDLDDLDDVNVPTPTDGDVLYWDDAAGKWQDKAISAPSDLDDLDDVNVPTPTDGNVLYWDNSASKWQDKAVSAPSALDDLDDVNVPTPTDGNVLYWDNSASKWQDKAVSGTKILDADADTKVDTEESSDEDHVRMDVAGVEAFDLDNNGILTLAKQSGGKIYKNSHQWWASGVTAVPEMSALDSDIQSEFTHDATAGTAAGGTSGTTLVATASIFAASDVGKTIYNTVDYTFATITAYTSATTVTISAAIFTSGEGFRFYFTRFTAKAAGNYLLLCNTLLVQCHDQKLLVVRALKNGVTQAQSTFYMSGLNNPACQLIAFLSLAAGDYVDVDFYHGDGSAQRLYAGIRYTYFSIRKIS